MKKNITTLLLSCCALWVNAQITLDQSNTPHSGSYQYSGTYNTNGVTVPTEGVNEIFDYTNLPTSTGFGVDEFLPPTRAGFTSYTRYFIGQSTLANIPLYSEYYTEIDANGIYEVGSYKLTQSVNLMSITGSSNDSIFFPGGSNIFTTPVPILAFPNSFGSSTTSNYQFQTNFNLTVAAFGLLQTPGINQQNVELSVVTVGYGKLILPMASGQSIPYDVLLVKNQRIVVDSVFLAGAPAPASLLNAFGLVQGDTTYQNNYYFYGKGFDTPIYSMNMNEDWTSVNFSDYDATNLQLDVSTGILDNESFQQVNVYPNPASDKIVISFELQEMGKIKIVIYDVYGKIVKNIQPKSLTAKYQNIPVDVSEISNGVYFIHINNGKESSMKKIIINK